MQCCFPYRTLKYLLQYSVNTLLSNKYYCNMFFVDYILIGWEMFGSDTVIAIINTKKYQLLIDLYSDRWECKTYPIMPFMGIKMCTKMHKKGIYCQYRKYAIHQYCIYTLYHLQHTKRAFISLHISTVGVIRLYFKCIVKFDQTTFYFWTISNTMHHKLCSLCKRHLLFQR